MTPRRRAWCAKCCWGTGNFSPFCFGTVFAESELEAERLIKTAWAEICPHPMKLLALLPGQLVFCAEADDAPMR